MAGGPSALGLEVTTRWRSIPEMFPPDYPGLVDVGSPEQVASKLLSLPLQESGEGFRALFQQQCTLSKHLAGLADALRSVGSTQPSAEAQAMTPQTDSRF